MKTIIKNKQAYHSYEILDKLEAGIVLLGCEIKSIRKGQVSIKESYAKIKDNEVWIMGLHIAPYQQGTPENYNPIRPRKLLLNRIEIKRLIGKLQEKGLNLIPLAIYMKKNRAKVELGLAKGLKKYDKRNRLKERDMKKDLEKDKRKYMV